MEKFTIKVTESAAQDLRELRVYLTQKFGDTTALDTLQKIILTYTSLSDFPYKGKKAEGVIPMLEGYHYLPTNKNVVFYSVNVSLRMITIHRIFSNREDFIQKFISFIREDTAE